MSFKPLTKDELRKIIDLLLNKITKKLAEKNITLTLSDSAKDVILEKGYDVKYGARPLKRAIQTLLEDKLAKLSLLGEIRENKTVNVEAKDKELEITVM